MTRLVILLCMVWMRYVWGAPTEDHRCFESYLYDVCQLGNVSGAILVVPWRPGRPHSPKEPLLFF